MGKRANTFEYAVAIQALRLGLTAKNGAASNLTAICKQHGVSVNLATTLRRLGYVSGRRSASRWVGPMHELSPEEVVRIRAVTLGAVEPPKPAKPRVRVSGVSSVAVLPMTPKQKPLSFDPATDPFLAELAEAQDGLDDLRRRYLAMQERRAS